MKLFEALRVTHQDVIAFTGAGGKTSALVRLGSELHQAGWRVLATTTTRIGEDQLSLFPHSVDEHTVERDLEQYGYVFAYSAVREHKAYGFPPEILSNLINRLTPDVVLIEADGARQKWLKAPYPHEPVIIPETTLVIPVVSYLSVGQPLDEAHVYNPQAIADQLGCRIGDVIQAEWVAAVLSNADMGLKGVPERARVIGLINAVGEATLPQARVIARMALESPRLQAVLIANTWAEDAKLVLNRQVAKNAK